MRASTALLMSLVLGGCRREASVTFLRRAAPEQVEVSSTQRLALRVLVGLGEGVEPQEHEREVRLRARVERSSRGQVVRWLEHSGVAALEGRSFTVGAGRASSIEGGGVLDGEQAAETVALAHQVAGPDAVQVALMREPLLVGASAPHLDAAFVVLARRALGSSAVVSNAALRLEGSSDTRATFSASLDAVTISGPVTMRLQLHGTLEVRRADTAPLALTLEGPVEVSSTPSEDEPRVSGKGSFTLTRRVSALESVDQPPVSASERLTTLHAMFDR